MQTYEKIIRGDFKKFGKVTRTFLEYFGFRTSKDLNGSPMLFFFTIFPLDDAQQKTEINFWNFRSMNLEIQKFDGFLLWWCNLFYKFDFTTFITCFLYTSLTFLFFIYLLWWFSFPILFIFLNYYRCCFSQRHT